MTGLNYLYKKKITNEKMAKQILKNKTKKNRNRKTHKVQKRKLNTHKRKNDKDLYYIKNAQMLNCKYFK